VSRFQEVCRVLGEPPRRGPFITQRNAVRVALRVALLALVTFVLVFPGSPGMSWAGPLLALGLVPAAAVELWGEPRAGSGITAGLLGVMAAALSYAALVFLVAQVGYAQSIGGAGMSPDAVSDFLEWLKDALGVVVFVPLVPAFLLGLGTFLRLRRRHGQAMVETSLLAMAMLGLPAVAFGLLMLVFGGSASGATWLVASAAVVAILSAYGAVLLSYLYFWADFCAQWVAGGD
jgi:hypothetical protein